MHTDGQLGSSRKKLEGTYSSIDQQYAYALGKFIFDEGQAVCRALTHGHTAKQPFGECTTRQQSVLGTVHRSPRAVREILDKVKRLGKYTF